MVTKTERIDLKLKGCTISANNELLDENEEVVNLIQALKELYGADAFDLGTNSVKKSSLEVEGIPS